MKLRRLLPLLALAACTDAAPRVADTRSPALSPSSTASAAPSPTASAWRTAARLELRPVVSGPLAPAECAATSTASPRPGTPLRNDEQCYFAGPVVLRVDRLTRATADEQQGTRGWIITLELPPDTGRALHAVTTRYLNQPLLLVLDGQLMSAPVVQAPVSDAVVITGDFTREEAERVAARLRASA